MPVSNDHHRERDRTAHQARGIQRDLPDVLAIITVFVFVLLRLADDVLGHHDARVHQHSYGDGDAAQRHDV
jgi:hypothetical protein